MVKGRRLLDEHLTRSRLTLREFADLVGTSASLVCMWRAGERIPGIGFALRIEKATAGKIRPADWVERKKRGKRVLREASAPYVTKGAT